MDLLTNLAISFWMATCILMVYQIIRILTDKESDR